MLQETQRGYRTSRSVPKLPRSSRSFHDSHRISMMLLVLPNDLGSSKSSFESIGLSGSKKFYQTLRDYKRLYKFLGNSRKK